MRGRVLKDDIDHHLCRGKPDIARLKNTDQAYQSLPKEFKEGVGYFDSLNKGWNRFFGMKRNNVNHEIMETVCIF